MTQNQDRHLHSVDSDVNPELEASIERHPANQPFDEINDENWFIETLPESVRDNVRQGGWRISSPDAAGFAEARYYEVWARKKVNDLQTEDTVKLLEAEIERVKARNEERNKPFINALNFWSGHLLDYVLQLRQQDDNVKSWKGLYAEVSTRAQQATFEIADKEAFTRFVTENKKDDWFELEVKFKKANIKKEVKYQDSNVIDPSTGAIIEGLVAEPAKIVAKIDIDDETDETGKVVLHPVRQMYVLESGN